MADNGGNVNLEWLQRWYLAQCNGEWERVRGVTMETLETPGWFVTIDVAETKWEGSAFATMHVERSKTDWLHCTVVEGQFRGEGDAGKLEAILAVFRNWVES